jgi:hypothetical protein
MRLLLLCGAMLGAASLAWAQSPAATESKTVGGKKVEIRYSSPRVRNRAGKIFTKDGLISQDPNYPVWRAGANSATVLHTDADLNIGGLAVPKGDYSLFVDIADSNNWQLILNKQTGQSGLDYDKSQDFGRVKMTMSKPKGMIENLMYTITDLGGNKGKLDLAWESYSASVQFTVR